MRKYSFHPDSLAAIAGQLFKNPQFADAVVAAGVMQNGLWTLTEEQFQEIAKRLSIPPLTVAPAVAPPATRAQPPALAREADTVSWLTKARNFATATAKHIAAGMPTASDEVILQRWTICQGCEFLKNDACSKCGCPVARDKKFVSKLAWADQSCPVGKWGPAVT